METNPSRLSIPKYDLIVEFFAVLSSSLLFPEFFWNAYRDALEYEWGIEDWILWKTYHNPLPVPAPQSMILFTSQTDPNLNFKWWRTAVIAE